jgi:DNA-binding NtrC family response regulator
VTIMGSNREGRNILIVESDPNQQRYFAALLGRGGWRTTVVDNTDDGLHLIDTDEAAPIDAVLTSHSAGGRPISNFVSEIRHYRPMLPTVCITELGNVDDAVRLMHAGATDFIQRPIIADRLLESLERSSQADAAKDELRPLTEKLRANLAFDEIVGSSPNFRSALAIAAKSARTRVPVMITGRSGTGKEVFARAIHGASPRARAPLMMLDCSAVSPGLIASSLFGHERGAFPGAFERHTGQLVQADGGTMVIDHVECMPADAQSMLMQFLQTQDVQTIGGNIRRRVDLRVIATSSTPLDRMVESGHFREDLYEALAAAQIQLPSLSERRSDIAPLARHLAARIGTLPHMPAASITDAAMQLLAAFAWPGNVRQLQDVLFRATLASGNGILTPDDFPAIQSAIGDSNSSSRIRDQKIAVHGDAMGITLYQSDGHLRPLEEIEADVIRLAIGHYRGRMSEVARRLGIGRSTLYRKLSDLGIDTAA